MKPYFGDKQSRFSLRKLSIGLVSATISSLFIVAISGNEPVQAQENIRIQYKYVTDAELSSSEKELIVSDIPRVAEEDSIYYLVYQMDSKTGTETLPHTGGVSNGTPFLFGSVLATTSILILLISKGRVKRKLFLTLLLSTGLGGGLILTVSALENKQFFDFNTNYQLVSGEKLPLPQSIAGYSYIGYIKNGIENSSLDKTTRDSIESSQWESEVKKGIKRILPQIAKGILSGQFETPLSKTDDKEIKKGNNNSDQPGYSQLTSPVIEPVLPDDTDSQSGSIVAPAVQDALPEYSGPQSGSIVAPAVQDALPEYSGPQSGSIVAPAVQDSLPEYSGPQSGSIVTPAVQDELPEYSGPQSGSIVAPEVQDELPEYSGPQSGSIVAPAVQDSLPEYSGPQFGSVVAPAVQDELPEYNGPQSGSIVAPEERPSLEVYKGDGSDEFASQGDPIEKQQNLKKTLEVRSISDIELYRVSDGEYKQEFLLDHFPSDTENYFIKIKSSKWKDRVIPVSSIVESEKNGQAAYKITAYLETANHDTIGDSGNPVTFYIGKRIKGEKKVFTSFANLVEAIEKNPNGTYYLGASLNALEVALPEKATSYISTPFTGKLIGEKDGKSYAIDHLTKPLFSILDGATVENLTLDHVMISSKENVGALANEIKHSSHIQNVHVVGELMGERGLGGLAWKVENSRITNSSFEGNLTNQVETNASYEIGGLAGQIIGKQAEIVTSRANIILSTNATKSDQVVGGLAGLVAQDAAIRSSYAQGKINNSQPYARVGGLVGSLWDVFSNKEQHSGTLSRVLSDVVVQNGGSISGYSFTGMKVTETYQTPQSERSTVNDHGIVIKDDQIEEKKVVLVPKVRTRVEPLLNRIHKESDFTAVATYQAKREVAYRNIEKMLPFYNKETIVAYGNLVGEDSNLYQKELLSLVMMKGSEIITDLASDKQSADTLLLHYQDASSEKLEISYRSDFEGLPEYSVGKTGLLYTPNQFLIDSSPIVQAVLPELQAIAYQSEGIRKVLGISSANQQRDLYLEEQFTKTQDSLEETLKKLLSSDAVLLHQSQAINDAIINKIRNHKEAFLLGLAYLERWYNFYYGDVSAKDLVLYHMDFFGNSAVSPLDTIIELGQSGYANLVAKQNVATFAGSLAKKFGRKDLFTALEGYRKVFLPTQTNNDWFKSQTKAFIVEEKSTIPEVREKQSQANSIYSIGVYDRLTSKNWNYQNMVLPLLTLPEKSVFVVATISSLGFGAYDRYRDSHHRAGDELNHFVEDNVRETAKRHRDHYDYWYKLLDETNRKKLFRNILLYDAYQFGTDNELGKPTKVANLYDSNPAMKHFFGPVGNDVMHNEHGAYATGDAVYFMSYRMLDKDGAVTYTHEMTHDSDGDIYLGGYGRRSGLGPEFFAKGLLQAPDHPDDATITINSILKYNKADGAEKIRLQVLDPTERFQSSEDLRTYLHNLFDVIYLLEYLEGQSVVKLTANEKLRVLRKIENQYLPDRDGNSIYATNVVRRLSLAEAERLTSFHQLIEENILSARSYTEGTYARNGYYTIQLFSPIYAALSSEKGTPGDLMGRRIAYELLAAKGFQDGMVPYISNQFEKEARERGKVITSYGVTKGLVTDDLVLEKVFQGQYPSWVAFKKAMYQERILQFPYLNKVTFVDPKEPWYKNVTKTITRIDELQKLMDEAVRKDLEVDDGVNEMPEYSSAVHKLKKAVFKAYLDKTDDFRSSIFQHQK
ncbi:IgA1 protease [Streptococcus sp. DD10]|uniref:ZmpA/ZmpB/ZmpC family metallo-endopeptidase n=1 Tax=Streptococcus sp. DD10 TaxID=1777878 RepID=UPI00079820A2|nr:ZmpA/ZmpB/ZmpC family metallo-endopeptidase [Streptococcus sp. DD10]KXT74431.1 IgA1 protease [Streptococcus sp. DD10]